MNLIIWLIVGGVIGWLASIFFIYYAKKVIFM